MHAGLPWSPFSPPWLSDPPDSDPAGSETSNPPAEPLDPADPESLTETLHSPNAIFTIWHFGVSAAAADAGNMEVKPAASASATTATPRRTT